MVACSRLPPLLFLRPLPLFDRRAFNQRSMVGVVLFMQIEIMVCVVFYGSCGEFSHNFGDTLRVAKKKSRKFPADSVNSVSHVGKKDAPTHYTPLTLR